MDRWRDPSAYFSNRSKARSSEDFSISMKAESSRETEGQTRERERIGHLRKIVVVFVSSLLADEWR